MRRVIVKICLPCLIDLISKIFRAVPPETTMADMEQVGQGLGIYEHEEAVGDGRG